MKPLRTLVCEKHGLPESEFQRYLFWRCLYPHAVPLVPFFGGFGSSYFDPDRNLISNIGAITTRRALRDEIIDYFMDPENRVWTRRVGRIRVSTTTLRRTVIDLLPSGHAHVRVRIPNARTPAA